MDPFAEAKSKLESNASLKKTVEYDEDDKVQISLFIPKYFRKLIRSELDVPVAKFVNLAIKEKLEKEGLL